MDIESLRQREKEITYPGNQHFDVETLEPYGEEPINRFKLSPQTMPEIEAGGDSLLDIGSNKGLVCFHYRNKFKKVVGYEVSPVYSQFAKDVCKYHNLDNVTFINGGMRDVLLDRNMERLQTRDTAMQTRENVKMYSGAFIEKYDVVYCGSVHHHFYKDALLYNAEPFLWCRKLAALTKNYLILDGPMSIQDPSVQVFSKEGNWTAKQRAAFNFDNIIEALLPQFELIRINPSERRRFTAVFKRVANDIEYVTDMEVSLAIRNRGERLIANAARDKDSMWRIDDYRVKYDKGLLSDGMYMILNYLKKHFMSTENVIVDGKGNRLGDVSEWISGPIPEETDENKERCYQNFIRMNANLSHIGLMEPHYKVTDYKPRGNQLVDIDVDMIRHVNTYNQSWKEKWLQTKTAYFPARANEFKYIFDNWESAKLYHELIERG